jgi:DNA-directed RNA polymerase specialized sigma24 family protein
VPHDDVASLASAAPAAPAADAALPDEPLWRLVDALPQRQREAVVLKYVTDLDHQAIAAMLGTSPAMSRRLVSDALATLRKDLT